MQQQPKPYKRKLLSHERRPFRGPNASVVLNVRIKGEVTVSALRAAVKQVQRRHRLLSARVALDCDGTAWFTSDGAEEIVVDAVSRRSGEHWIEETLKAYRIPYEFDRRPPLRFILLHGPERSDLVIMCHHMICDAMSLACLARDVLVLLGDPAHEVEILPDPPLANRENMPPNTSSSLLARLATRRLNHKWEQECILFDERDYAGIFQAYWETYTPRVLALEFSASQTADLVACCREQGVTVNTALLAALLSAQSAVQGNNKAYLHKVGTAMDIRSFLLNPPGEAFGFYAGGALLRFKIPPRRSFWDGTRKLHKAVRRQLTPISVFAKLLAFDAITPTLFDGMIFKRYARLVKPHHSRYARLSAFRERRDVLASYLKSNKKEQVRVGIVLSNLTRLPFPNAYGGLELERMMFLGAATEAYEKAVGVVTVSGRLSMMISYLEETVGTPTMLAFKTALLDLLVEQIGW